MIAVWQKGCRPRNRSKYRQIGNSHMVCVPDGLANRLQNAQKCRRKIPSNRQFPYRFGSSRARTWAPKCRSKTSNWSRCTTPRGSAWPSRVIFHSPVHGAMPRGAIRDDFGPTAPVHGAMPRGAVRDDFGPTAPTHDRRPAPRRNAMLSAPRLDKPTVAQNQGETR